MGFFAPGELAASTAERTSWKRLPGFFSRGCPREVELECRWYYNSDMRAALAVESFRSLDEDAQKAAENAMVARHVVVGWRNVPKEQGATEDAPYSAEGCAEILAVLRKSVLVRADGLYVIPWTDFKTSLVDAKEFGAQLVDPVELGKE